MSTEAPEQADELSKPLGKKTKRKKPFVVPGWLVGRAIAGVLGLCVAVLIGWILLVDEPYGGEPMATASADMRAAPQSGKPAAANNAVAPPTTLTDDNKPSSASGQTVTIIDGTTGKRQEITVTPTAAAPGTSKSGRKPEARSGVPTADPRLIENSRHGPIPKIAPDGARPSEVYAKPPKPQASRADAPRIAIVIEGLGIGAARTSEAFAKLPAEVTYAFAPYGTDLDRWVGRARSEGHEVLLQIGMEPFDFPESDPGPQTLLTSLSAEQNIDRLHWFLSRFQGYVGVTTMMGARFTATDQALVPVLREIGKRGLIWFDDGASPRSLAGQVSGGQNVAYARADAMLDQVPTATEIDNALARLEATARSKGSAIGAASALPVTIDRISQWARTAEERGIALVPVSAIAKAAKTAS